MKRMLPLAALAALLLPSAVTRAAIITLDPLPVAQHTAVNPSLLLNGSLFLNLATTSGGDTGSPASAITFDRTLDLNGSPSAPGPGVVTFQGFAFASAGNTTPAFEAARATSIVITFTYLGADGLTGPASSANAADDVLIGSTETILYRDDDSTPVNDGFVGAGRYVVNFDTDPSAMIDGLNERFRIVVTPTGGQATYKTTAGQPANAASAKISVSGTFVRIPEPASAVMACASLGVLAAARWRR